MAPTRPKREQLCSGHSRSSAARACSALLIGPIVAQVRCRCTCALLLTPPYLITPLCVLATAGAKALAKGVALDTIPMDSLLDIICDAASGPAVPPTATPHAAAPCLRCGECRRRRIGHTCLCGSVAAGDPVVSPLGGDSARAPVGLPAPSLGSMESSDAMNLASMTRCNADRVQGPCTL